MPHRAKKMEAEAAPQEDQILSPAASAETTQESPAAAPAPAAEVSPGDGAFSPPHDGEPKQDREGGDEEAEGPAGFGPPPAFPTTRDSPGLGKRKRTLMAVSTGAGGAPLEDDSSEEDEGRGRAKSQTIHRGVEDAPARTPPGEEDEEGAKKYSDAMLLASLSDVDSPKKQEEAAAAKAKEATATASKEQAPERARSPKASSGTPSNAPTPLRSNVNPSASSVAEGVKPFALMPKPQAVQAAGERGGLPPNKRPKSSPTAMTAAPHSPDGRDPKSARGGKGDVKREGAVYAPQPSRAPPGAPPGYPGYHPGYPYPYPSQPGAPPPGAPGGYPPYGHPSYPYYHPAYSQGPPGSVPPSPYHRAAYYPGYPHPGADPRAPPGATGRGVPSPDRWGRYHSPKSGERKSASSGPEPVKSTTPPEAPYHPLSGPPPSSSSKSHVVPSEDAEDAQGGYGRPPPSGPPPPGYGPPPPGYDSRYGPPPPGTGDNYYGSGGPPPPHEYNAISRDEGTPPRSQGHPGEYPPGAHTPSSASVSTPPRGGSRGGPYADYYAQGATPPGSHPEAYPSPHAHTSQGYHPESPPRSSAPPGYGPPPPGYGPPGHDPYEPYDYASAPSPGYDHVPAAVSNETEHSHHPPTAHPGAPPPPSPYGSRGTHQFRKGGRSVHSEPIILRKKFSWRNYPELEEYLIANRTDYLRHSALNYTAEQKHFNNRLTEGLLELAAKLNYVFDETCFNFVAVRDRIRCYYKSYVQSSKKRGVVVGFGGKAGGAKKEEASA